MTEEDIRRVREATDLAGLVGADVGLRRRGGRLWASCPFHEDRTPSLMVDEATQHYHCFGCGAHGDAIDYVMRRQGLPFTEAVGLLAERAGIDISCGRGAERSPSASRLHAALAKAARHAQELLLSGTDDEPAFARHALATRGIGEDVLERWGVGYAPGGATLCRALREAGFTAREAGAAGLLRGGHDTLQAMACAPITDAAGNVVGLAGQRLPDVPRATPTFVAPRHWAERVSVGTGGGTGALACLGVPLGIEEARAGIARCAEALVTLGPIDALALHAAGTDNAVSTCGGGLSERAARSLAAAGARRITLLFPGVAGADEAAAASLPAVLAVPAEVRLAQFDGFGEAWTPVVCDEAPTLVDAVLEHVVRGSIGMGPQGVVDAISEACAILRPAAKGDPAKASLLARLAAEQLGVGDPRTLEPAILGKAGLGSAGGAGLGAGPLTENPRLAHPIERFALDPTAYSRLGHPIAAPTRPPRAGKGPPTR